MSNIHIQWYHNGTAVDESRTNSSLETQGERLTLSLTVFNATEEMDLGLYEGTVTVNVHDFYVSTGHPHNYYSYAAFLTSNLPVIYFPVVILQYGKLETLSVLCQVILIQLLAFETNGICCSV